MLTPETPINATSSSAAAEDGDVIRHPTVIGDTIALALALGHRCFPEADPFEFIQTVHGTAVISKQLVSLAGIRPHGHRAEPGCQIALQLLVEGPLQPLIGAVGMGCICMVG